MCVNGAWAEHLQRSHRLNRQILCGRVDSCLATLVDKPPKGLDWAFEVKWDGYRLAVHVEPGRVRVITRGGYDWTDRFPSIAAEAQRLGHETMILDGEAVVLDDKGGAPTSACPNVPSAENRACTIPAGRLLLAARNGEGLVYVGGCGTGWT